MIFKLELTAVTDRVSHVDLKVGEFASTFNELVDDHNERDDGMLWIKAKLADLEDRSRRNTVMIWGIPKSNKPPGFESIFHQYPKRRTPRCTSGRPAYIPHPQITKAKTHTDSSSQRCHGKNILLPH